MTDASGGALVPSVVKAVARGASMAGASGPAAAGSNSETTDAAAGTATATATAVGGAEEVKAVVGGEAAAGGGFGGGRCDGGAAAAADRDLLCPICMGLIKDAFLTACGHSFCYMCIVTHLNNKNDCPCCGHYLTNNHLYPNFLLNKLLKKTSAHQMAKTASPAEHLRLALQQGCEMSVKELDSLLSLLAEKKRKKEQEEAETNMQILLDFLHCLRKQKLEELNEVQMDLQYIKEDINAVERHRIELYRARERYSVKLRMLLDDPVATKKWPSAFDRHNTVMVSNACTGGTFSGNLQSKKVEMKSQGSSQGLQRKETFSGADPQHSLTQSGLAVARKKRIHAQFNELQECYIQKRRQGASHHIKQEERDSNVISREGYHAGLEDFQSVLTTFTRYSRLRVIAELRHGDLFHSANIVSSFPSLLDKMMFKSRDWQLNYLYHVRV